MRAKIENKIGITVDGVDLTTLKDLEFYIKQGKLFFELKPEIIDANTMVATLSYEDAMKLKPNCSAMLQFAFTDADDDESASDIIEVEVEDLLKGEGYDGIL